MVYFINIKQGFCLVILLYTNLLETYHSIVQHIDEGKLCCNVFCDLSKAQRFLIECGTKVSFFKLQTGDLLHWFSSYLGHRSQKVMYKDQLSSQLDIF